MARRKLTAKQEAFSQCVAGGAGTQSQCYRDITQTVDRDAESVASEIERRLEGLLVTSPEPEPEALDSESESFH